MSRTRRRPAEKPWIPDNGTCEVCGKAKFRTRREAEKVARSRSMQNIDAYQCGDAWHLGHLPRSVRQGKLDRDSITPLKGTL